MNTADQISMCRSRFGLYALVIIRAQRMLSIYKHEARGL